MAVSCGCGSVGLAAGRVGVSHGLIPSFLLKGRQDPAGVIGDAIAEIAGGVSIGEAGSPVEGGVDDGAWVVAAVPGAGAGVVVGVRGVDRRAGRHGAGALADWAARGSGRSDRVGPSGCD